MGIPTARNVAPAGSEYAETVRSNYCRVDSDDFQDLVDSHDQELAVEVLTEMHEEEIEELDVLRPSSIRRMNDGWEIDRRPQFDWEKFTQILENT
ncbi:hypothetical protein TNCV_3257651 [Trichonephila clavipes]|nr:hypothetical protein TNCV_3257651 [Trichonephila clavipes]